MVSSARSNRLVPIGLVLLGAIPVLAGGIRVAELSGTAEVTADNARFFAAPAPILVHVIAASLFTVLGALQFAPRHGRWHRRVGRLLAPLGLAAALSGLWMTLTYPLPEHDSDLLNTFRLLFGSGMAVSILLGVSALRRRDFARHGAWMTRAYAIGMGAGTQALLLGFWEGATGATDALARAVLSGAAWALNLAVAETVIRRRAHPAHTNTPAHIPAM
ncbi:DUF2306 domain-containing protein [Nocardia arizonensis]|uniref:DUF2306 domain-containing protein n=1 Tax=Nocardia arizonensis TaxID=1141647 RepID=UPI0006D16D98|nr:DUF2306 domain-containing protein [Nocardia arizonensis]